MTVTANTDFTTYQGDSVSPIFTVVDASGNPLNISGVGDIVWSARRNDATAPAVTKKKSIGGQIVFVTTGADGRFQVNLVGADTTALTGFYIHTAALIDGFGNQSTVTVGRLQVGLPPSWSYDPTQLSTQALYAIRMLAGDTVESDPQFTDEEVQYAASQNSTLYGAASMLAFSLAAKFSRSVDYQAGGTKASYSQLSKQYRVLAITLASQAAQSGAGLPYAGGISEADKLRNETDDDRISPQFTIAMDDNLFPVPSGGGETLSQTAGRE